MFCKELTQHAAIYYITFCIKTQRREHKSEERVPSFSLKITAFCINICASREEIKCCRRCYYTSVLRKSPHNLALHSLAIQSAAERVCRFRVNICAASNQRYREREKKKKRIIMHSARLVLQSPSLPITLYTRTGSLF
jgi:hypothetical protein